MRKLIVFITLLLISPSFGSSANKPYDYEKAFKNFTTLSCEKIKNLDAKNGPNPLFQTLWDILKDKMIQAAIMAYDKILVVKKHQGTVLELLDHKTPRIYLPPAEGDIFSQDAKYIQQSLEGMFKNWEENNDFPHRIFWKLARLTKGEVIGIEALAVAVKTKLEEIRN